MSEHETVPAPVTPDDADLYVEAIEDGRRMWLVFGVFAVCLAGLLWALDWAQKGSRW